MTKAEERALEAYPKLSVASVCLDGTTPVDLNTGARKRFIEGYEQAEKDLADVAMFSSGPDGFYYGRGYQQGMKDAEKDLALTWEDIRNITKILEDIVQEDILVEFYNGDAISCYKEVLRRFKEAKK